MRPVSRGLSMLAAAFGVAGCAIMAANLVNLFAPLILVGGTGSVPSQSGLAVTFLRLHGLGYNISIAFFSVQVGVLGYLVVRSTFLPRILGVLLLIEAACNLLSTFGGFLAWAWVMRFDSYILLPGLVAEGGMTLWLLALGVDARKWAVAADENGRH